MKDKYESCADEAAELRNWLIKTFSLEVTMLQLLNKNTKIEDLVKGAAGVEIKS